MGTSALVDEFHAGKLLLPWHQLVEFGQYPGHGFQWTPGGLGLFVSFFNELFYDGKIQTYPDAAYLLAGVFSGFTAILLFRKCGDNWSWLLAPLIYSLFLPVERVFLIPLFIVLLFLYSKNWSNQKWFAVWASAVLLAIGWHGATGVAFFLGTLPLGISKFCNHANKDNVKRNLFRIFIVCSLLFLFAAIFLMGPLKLAFDSQAGYSQAYGIPWLIRPHAWAIELRRFAFASATLLFFALFLKRKTLGERDLSLTGL